MGTNKEWKKSDIAHIIENLLMQGSMQEAKPRIFASKCKRSTSWSTSIWCLTKNGNLNGSWKRGSNQTAKTFLGKDI